MNILEPANKILLKQITIPNYIREVQVAGKRKAKYIQFKGKIPKKYKNPNYTFRLKNGKPLLHTVAGELIIANTNTAGTPRIIKIKGNGIWYGGIKQQTRNDILIAVKKFFAGYLKDIGPIAKEDFPIRIEVELVDAFNDSSIKNQRWDVSNRWMIYQKALEDILTDLGIIPDDDRTYITGPPSVVYTPIDNTEDRKLIISIYSDKREVIKQSKYY